MFADRRTAAAGIATVAGLAVMELADLAAPRREDDEVHDDGTVQLVSAAIGTAIVVSAGSLLRHPRLPRGRRTYWAGLATTWAGIAVNRWARRTLAATYRPVVTIVEGQDVVERGPYRWVRHPMYSGGLLICAGLGAALDTWPTRLAWLLPPVAILKRIEVEERALRAGLGERYEAYAAQRRRLAPGVW